MSHYAVIAFLLTANLIQGAPALAASRDCELLWDHVLGVTPQESCLKFNGYRCSTSKSPAEALCRASGKMDECAAMKNLGEAFCMVFGGNICNDSKTELQGLCLAVGEPTCHIPDPTKDRRYWLRKLLERCGK